jgi:DNA-binding CsgD family transcriptional regulator
VSSTLRSVPVIRKGLSPVMVGRSAQLRSLLALVPTGGQAAAGDPGDETAGPGLALIGGEAGIGKSRLVGELLAALPDSTMRLVGRAGQGAPGRPFSVLLDAVEPTVAGWTSVPAALAGRAEAIALLLDPVAPDLGPCHERQYGPEELLRGAIDLVRFLVPGPAVLVFDDLHVADPESISLFGRLATTSDLDVLLVGTYRPEDLGRRHPLAGLVGDLERRRSITHLSLERLGRGSVGELLSAVYRRPLSWHVADTVHRRTGGNPFFVEELLMAAGEADPERLATLPLPWNLSEVVLRHLDGLDAEQRRVVDAAAVLGSRFPFDALAAVVGSSEEHLIPVLRCLVEVGLLVEDEPDVFSFRHALTREAVAGQLLGRERRRLHEKALAVMCEQASDDYTALAHHAQGAGRYEEVVAFARQGAARFLQLGLTHQALRLAELGLAEDSADAELQRLASQAAWFVGLLDLARRRAVEWRRLASAAGDRVSEGAALRHLARLEWESGNSDGQRIYAEEALALAEADGPGEPLALAMALISEVHMLAQHETSDGSAALEAVRWADRALALADRLGRPELRPRALVNKGSAIADTPGRVAEGVAILEQARAEAEAVGDTWNQARALNNVLSPGTRLWPEKQIQAALDEIRDVAWRTGREGSTMMMWAGWAAQLAMMQGDMQAARDRLATGRHLSQVVEDTSERWWHAILDLDIAVEAGDWGEAESVLSGVGGTAPDGILRLKFETRAAQLTALRGDPAGGTERLLAIVKPGQGRHPCEDLRMPILTAAVTLLRHEAAPAAIRRLVTRLDQTWPAWPDLPATIGIHVEAALLEAEGRQEEALEAYRDAIADPNGYRPAAMVADAEQGVARCLLAAGRIEDARAAVGRAVALLEGWPGWRSAQAAALLRRTTPSAHGGDGVLTTREREVAALVAEGLSNGQIAQRLYISTKTASVHVSNILAKLGMASRAEVAVWAVREGVASAPT